MSVNDVEFFTPEEMFERLRAKSLANPRDSVVAWACYEIVRLNVELDREKDRALESQVARWFLTQERSR